MKGTWLGVMAVLVLGLILILPDSSIADEKSLPDILKEKGILTEEEYQEAKKAEEAQKASPPAEKPAAQPIAGYKNGFFLQTPDGTYKLTLTGYLRSQLRLYENNTSQDNEFKVRQTRVVIDGSYGKYWQSKVAAEFTTPSDGKFLKFAYLNCSYLPDLQFRAGQFKAPFAREYQVSEAEVDTAEWAMIVDSAGLNPKYDIGIMLHGPAVFNGLLSYGVGIFNGNLANNNDTNDDKDLVARAVLAPFAPTDIAALKGLEFGGSYETGRQTSDKLDALKFAPKLPTDWQFFKGVDTTGKVGDLTYRGQRDRYGLELLYRVGPLKLQGEWIYQRLEREKQVRVNPETNQIVSSGGKLIDGPDLIAWGWYILGTYFIWGNPDQGIQLVARYEQMDVDDEPASKKYREANPMPKNSVSNPYGNALNLRGNTADVLTLGINYFPFRNVKLAFNWLYQTLDNPYTTDKIIHDHEGGEVVTAKGHAMNAFYLLAQVKW